MPCALGVPYNGESGPAWRAKWLPCAMHEKIATGFSDGERCLDITLILVKWLQVITGEKITWSTIHWLFMRRYFFPIHFKWEHTGGDRTQAEMAQKCFRHLFQSQHDLSNFSLTYPCNVGRTPLFQISPLFPTQNHFPWICPLVIYYRLFWTLAISDYFHFPWEIASVNWNVELKLSYLFQSRFYKWFLLIFLQFFFFTTDIPLLNKTLSCLLFGEDCCRGTKVY